MAYEFVSARFGELGTRHIRTRAGVLLFFLISFECRCKAIRRDNRRYLIEFSAIQV